MRTRPSSSPIPGMPSALASRGTVLAPGTRFSGSLLAAVGSVLVLSTRFARSLLAVGSVLVLSMLAACGRKATQQDCSLILDRNVEVQMRQMKVTDPVAIEKRKGEIRGEMKEQLKDCVGKHVTDSMIACVSKAQTAEEIDGCMR